METHVNTREAAPHRNATQERNVSMWRRMLRTVARCRALTS